MKRQVARHVVDPKEIVDAHFSKLNRLLQNEEKEDRTRFEEEVTKKKPEERQRSGKALLFLNLQEMHYNPSGQRLLTFGYPNNKWLPRYSLQAGDLISLSSVKTSEADRPTGTVYEKDKHKITVAFSSKLPGWVGHEQVYHLNMSTNKTTYDRMYQAIREVGGAKHSQVAVLRDISLGLKTPSLRDPIAPEKINFFNERLNALQRRAVSRALEAEEVTLIHGPPGTGKTLVLVEIIRQARREGHSVLVSAPSNAACDHVVDCLVECDVPVTRFGHPARMSARIREHTFAYKLAEHPMARLIDQAEARLEQILRQKDRRHDRRIMSWDEQKAAAEEMRALRQEIKDLKTQIFRLVWSQSDVVVATHTVCGDPLIRERTFDWVIVDEATQGTEPATWIPASRAGRLVLAGDHCQLPPTIFSRRAGQDGLNRTLFERFHDVLPVSSKIRLEVQYRMHRRIMDFPSQEFYDGRLEADPQVAAHLLADLPAVRRCETTEAPVVFIDTAGLGYEDSEEPGSGSRANPEEAKLVLGEYFKLIGAGVDPGQIAIISPYSAQVKVLTQMVLDAGPGRCPGTDFEKTEIDSVDAFQGREKEAVLVSLVRSNLKGQLGFLTDTRRMNVAMTRAKRRLVVVGDSATLSTIDFYRDFLEYVEKINAYRSGWEEVNG
ncbi:MAG: AAA domain-containing protein [Candidatus Omnitrophota bacterium]